MFDFTCDLTLWLFQVINGENYREAFIGEMYSKDQQTGANQDPQVSVVIIHFLIGVLIMMRLCSALVFLEV